PAAQAEDAARQSGPGDCPAGLVDLVDALVADVAVAEVPEPVPAVMNQVFMEGLFFGRPQPEVEVEFLRRSLRRGITDGGARVARVALFVFVTQAARHQ